MKLWRPMRAIRAVLPSRFGNYCTVIPDWKRIRIHFRRVHFPICQVWTSDSICGHWRSSPSQSNCGVEYPNQYGNCSNHDASFHHPLVWCIWFLFVANGHPRCGTFALPHAQWTTCILPHAISTRRCWKQCKFHDLHAQGCPVYCLERDVHDGINS